MSGDLDRIEREAQAVDDEAARVNAPPGEQLDDVLPPKSPEELTADGIEFAVNTGREIFKRAFPSLEANASPQVARIIGENVAPSFVALGWVIDLENLGPHLRAVMVAGPLVWAIAAGVLADIQMRKAEHQAKQAEAEQSEASPSEQP